jgi:hypothetical protein
MAERLREILQRPEKGSFMTVHVLGEVTIFGFILWFHKNNFIVHLRFRKQKMFCKP